MMRVPQESPTPKPLANIVVLLSSSPFLSRSANKLGMVDETVFPNLFIFISNLDFGIETCFAIDSSMYLEP